jgi:hypothetical protein
MRTHCSGGAIDGGQGAIVPGRQREGRQKRVVLVSAKGAIDIA